MADESQPARPGASSAASSSSGTRRSSQVDVMTRSAPDIRDQSPRERSRQGLKPLQSYKLDDPAQRLAASEATTPVNTRPQRSPQLLRRPSAKVPRRGQEFSVDDDSTEVEAEGSQHEPAKRATATGSMRGLNPSTVRRRTTAHAPRLPFIDSNDGEDDEEGPRTATTPRVDRKDFEPKQELSRRNTVDGAKIGSRSRTQTFDDAGNGEAEDDEDTPVDDDNNEDGDDDDEDLSDAESFTLKDRQEAINETHPFGIRIWKPALYKKGRSVEKDAEGDIHSAPGGNVSNWLLLFNYAWTIIFGWWLALIAATGALLCHVFAFAPGCGDYGRVLWGLARYILYPFGKYVKLISEEAYADEDEGEGRSISEYERWQQGDLEEGRLFFGPVRSLVGRRRSEEHSDDETESLLGRDEPRDATPTDEDGNKTKRRLFGRGQWNLGRVIFFVFFYGLITPTLTIVSMICWLLVFTIPMARVTLLLLRHLRRRPLALEFHADSTYTRRGDAGSSAIILCTYRAVGIKYWKYTIDGTNIFLINLLGVVAFVIFDYWVLYTALGMRIFITNTILVFLLALFSIIPLAYFIGQAVASISAQSTMGVGAAINAFFSTIVEVFLYCVALQEGKARLVEGSLIGSIFAGILLLPGISMCFGAIKRKTQRFNVRSAGVTTTMLLFAVIGSFSPTLFYEIYGSHEINCHQCKDEYGEPLDRDCRKCFFAQVPAANDAFYLNAVRPYSWFAAILLFLSYVIGLLFTLRTHAATIWTAELDEKKVEKLEPIASRSSNHSAGNKPPSVDYGANSQSLKAPTTPGNTLARTDIRDSHLYKRILGQSLKQAGLGVTDDRSDSKPSALPLGMDGCAESGPSPEDNVRRTSTSMGVQGLSTEDSHTIIRHMAEMAATAATVAARDSTQNPRKASAMARTANHLPLERVLTPKPTQTLHSLDNHTPGQEPAAGGHDAPNWGRTKSYTVLLSATLAYAVIAEILVNTVDAVLANVDIDEKFLGITLFALVPNTTEFLNAISFAMNGNIALSMEIGSAYALQVCLLQIPAVVLFSAIYAQFLDPADVINHTFRLLFPQWDMVLVILCVFLLSYMYGEGKSNYFKGSILILSYLVVITGFYLVRFSEADAGHDNGGVQTAVGSRLVSQGGLSRNAIVL